MGSKKKKKNVSVLQKSKGFSVNTGCFVSMLASHHKLYKAGAELVDHLLRLTKQ